MTASPWTTSLQLSVNGDWDHDAIPNEWEARFRLNPLDPSDNTADHDGDGMNNRDEFTADTIPTDRESDLRLLEPAAATATGLLLRWRGGAESTQYIEAAASGPNGPWTVAYTNLPVTPVTSSVSPPPPAPRASTACASPAERQAPPVILRQPARPLFVPGTG